MAQDTIRTISLNNQAPGSVSQFNSTLPLADGEGSAGTSPNPARADHQHPIAIDAIYNAIYDKLYQSISQSIKEADHPVDSLYFTMSNENPKITFGFGEWVKIEGKFILGASSKYPLNSTGGSEDAVVVNHNHTQNMVWDYGNG